jgi:uncharacterized protein (DUF433 family)
MQTILAHFDGKNIVPDQPLSLPLGQALRVAIESVAPPLPTLPPELETVEYGGIRVRGTRISLFLLLEALDEGETWEQIQVRYPTVPHSAVPELRKYIQQHPDEMKSYLAAQRKHIETMRANSTQTLTLEILRKRAAETTGVTQS